MGKLLNLNKLLYMKRLLIICLIPLFSGSQPEQLQSIGSLTTYVISCPCKLFKYYEENQLFYFCKDKKTEITYLIKEFKHKDGLDIFLNTLNQNLYKGGEGNLDSITEFDKRNALDAYLNNNPNGNNIDFLSGEAILVNGSHEKKIFFSDDEFIVSYEISIAGKNTDLLNEYFDKSINSLALKQQNLKNIF